jgi:hypothetical protein
MGFEDEVEQSIGRPCCQSDNRSKRTYELTSSIVPRGTSFHHSVELEFPPIAFDPVQSSRCCSLPGPLELSAVNPDNGMDRPRSYRVNGNAAEAQLIRERSAP